MSVTDQYRPYNFSSTKCYVISFQAEAIKKIEAKMPPTAKRLKGIFISARCKSDLFKLLGTINLNFNDGAIKPLNLPVINSFPNLKNTVPVAFDEELKPHASVNGFYRDFGTGAIPQLFITVYFHYST